MTENSAPIPRRIDWSAPEGWGVWADEDGVHVKSRSGDCLEEKEVQRLFDIWAAARGLVAGGGVPSPRPPSREEIRAAGHPWREEHEKRRAIRAIEREFDTTDTAPF